MQELGFAFLVGRKETLLIMVGNFGTTRQKNNNNNKN